MYSCPPKQSIQQIMPGTDELQQLHQELEAISFALALLPTAQALLENPETEFQRQLQRRLKRLVIAQSKISQASEILRSLSARQLAR